MKTTRIANGDQRVQQSICEICGGTVRPGKGTVLEYGRVHALRCLAIAQQVILARRLDADDNQPSAPPLGV